jgi:hypothetical protein
MEVSVRPVAITEDLVGCTARAWQPPSTHVLHRWRAPCPRQRHSSISNLTPCASGVHVERSCGALDDLLRNHDLLDAFEAWQVEHGVKEYSLHDGAQPARPGLTVDRLPGDGAECFLRHSEIDPSISNSR